MNPRKAFFDRSIAVLDSLGCKYKIQSEWGEFGTLELAAPKKTRNQYRPRGYLDSIFNPMFDGMKVGDVVVVRYEPLKKLNTFQSIEDAGKTLHKWFCRQYGTGSVTYHTNKKDQSIEVMRLK